MHVITFGEVMLRLMPPGYDRLAQSLPGTLQATFGGAEVNVAVSVAMQGGRSAFVTALPDNAVTTAFEAELRKFDVCSNLIHKVPYGRFGIYFVETGANQRGGTVTYDRSESSISLSPPEEFDWDAILKGGTWFHTTGITPALSENAAAATHAGLQAAKRLGLSTSFDLNFRKKLWSWHPALKGQMLAAQTITPMLDSVDVLIANEEDAEQVLGIAAANSHVDSGKISIGGYADVARRILDTFPNLKRVAITLRESISATHNRWGAMLLSRGDAQPVVAPLGQDGQYEAYNLDHIVDRVGAGDSFGGALIFALQTAELAEPAKALAYAVAASCLKHSQRGDFNLVTRPEIEALAAGSRSGRVNR